MGSRGLEASVGVPRTSLLTTRPWRLQLNRGYCVRFDSFLISRLFLCAANGCSTKKLCFLLMELTRHNLALLLFLLLPNFSLFFGRPADMRLHVSHSRGVLWTSKLRHQRDRYGNDVSYSLFSPENKKH